MKKHNDTYVAVVEMYRLDGVNTFTLMKHEHAGHTIERHHHDDCNAVLR